MKPSRSAFLGYSYQKCIALFMLAKMDIERELQEIEIEATVENNFDDIKITTHNALIYCQIKDIDNISNKDLKIRKGQIIIKGKRHVLSEGINLLFFKGIDINCNTLFLGLPSCKISNIYIIPLSREKAESNISILYKHNEKRESIISQFFNIRLDERLLKIKQEELPIIDIYDIHLQEQTIYIGKKILKFEDILFIEGKPGVGKSHLVTCLTKEFENCLVYRFWVSNQDREYGARLLFQNFLSNITKELFQDYRYRTEEEIIEYLKISKKTVIIDGLDHVENHQKTEIESFIKFINKLKGKCKTIVLSRPLRSKIDWAKQQLGNWNFEETRTVLKKLYHIADYQICQNIFDVTEGYPILVRFVTEHYKLYNEIELSWRLKDINEYYNKIISNTDILSALSLFIASRSYIMESEISLFLEIDHAEIVKEFIKSNPYLFEIRLNRISLFHDSLNTFLGKKKIGNSQRISIVKQIVHKSLMIGEKRFMSRFAFFDLDKSLKLEIIKKYVSIDYFQQIILMCIDFEAIRVFYKQIRESLTEFDAEELEMIDYYDLSLIINIIERDHISTVNEFLYTYVKSILFNGFEDDDITSSEHLFCMYYYYKTKDATLLYNLNSDSHYNTERFYQNLNYDIWMEENYFLRHQKSFRKTKYLKSFLNQEIVPDLYEFFPHLLANLYLHETKIKELKQLQVAIKTYLDIEENAGDFVLKQALTNFKNIDTFFSQSYLLKAKDIILSLGQNNFPNEYHNNSLKELILLNSPNGSFSVWPKVLNYIRLSLYKKRKIDLASVGCFFAMYHNRKDVTVISIDEALITFEKKGLISLNKSIDIIVFTQSMSEKGIRHLLRSYIEQHSPSIILSVIKKYNPDQLQITWFDLPTEFINYFPDHLFNYALDFQLLRLNSHNKEIDFKDIHNVFHSNRKKELIENLKFFKYRVKISADHPSINELQELDCLFSKYVSDKGTEYLKTSEERYTQGILDADSVDFIKEKKLKVGDIAGYTNGYYSVFAELDIYKTYDKELIKQNASLIVHNALIGRIQSINMFASLYYFPGNFPKFVNDWDVEINFKDLYASFITILKISLLNNKLKYDSKKHIS